MAPQSVRLCLTSLVSPFPCFLCRFFLLFWNLKCWKALGLDPLLLPRHRSPCQTATPCFFFTSIKDPSIHLYIKQNVCFLSSATFTLYLTENIFSYSGKICFTNTKLVSSYKFYVYFRFFCWQVHRKYTTFQPERKEGGHEDKVQRLRRDTGICCSRKNLLRSSRSLEDNGNQSLPALTLSVQYLEILKCK